MNETVDECEVDASNLVAFPANNGMDGCDVDDCGAATDDQVRSLETAVLLHEIRADALRAAGLYDEYIVLCKRALQQVGTLQFHNRVFDKLTFSANPSRLEGLANVATSERLRADIEAATIADYEERFDALPTSVTAVNVRSVCCGGIWQAVVATGNGSRIWYRVEVIDDAFKLECLEGCDVGKDDRYSLITDIGCIAV
jgi:hypothetical protein